LAPKFRLSVGFGGHSDILFGLPNDVRRFGSDQFDRIIGFEKEFNGSGGVNQARGAGNTED
jgi:hypothetical protein